MTIEYAIKYLNDLKKCGKEEFGIAWDMLNAVEMGVAALREKAEREKACVWCEGINKNFHDGKHFNFYCSYCGRRLEGTK